MSLEGVPAIELVHVDKAFGDNQVIRDFSLRVEKGEIFTIIGPSGCGKSVTLKLILGLLRPDAGSIRVFGEEVVGMDEAELARIRRRLGMVFQMGALFDSFTVEENVAFALERHTSKSREERHRIVEEKLGLVGLAGTNEKLPSELSGGMRKRVSLARAIALEPEILLWDEPTTGLDPVMTSEIDRLIQEMTERLGVTSVVVTHDMKSAFRVSDRCGVHFQGALVQIGTPAEIQVSTQPFVHQFIHGLLEGPLQVRTDPTPAQTQGAA
jgi:phospholipid/cholesterol/gamma-HCH transport system ATP-binding protein